ncbi:MAG: DUF5947 family protein [Gemmatimonadaceae bacterium]
MPVDGVADDVDVGATGGRPGWEANDGVAREIGVPTSRLARLARAPRGTPTITSSNAPTGWPTTGAGHDVANTQPARSDAVGFSESAALAGADDEWEQCELCALEIPSEHRHLLDINSQRLLCVCRSCIILFDDKQSGGRRYKRMPEDVREVVDFALDDPLWERLGIPVDITFCFRSTSADRIVAFYPGPAGAAESMLQLSAWSEIEMLNPVLGALEPDVEALLIHRAHGERGYWLVPVDVCYRLVGIMRTGWRGLSGGEEVWTALESFFDDLRRRAELVDRAGARVNVRTIGNGARNVRATGGRPLSNGA